MQDLPLELISSIVSIIILAMIFRQYLQYKKVVDVIKVLNESYQNKTLSSDDKIYIKDNLKEYQEKLVYKTSFNKLMYPIFIIIAAGLTLVFEFSQIVIHFNIIVVAFIYITIVKMHLSNIVKYLEELDS